MKIEAKPIELTSKSGKRKYGGLRIIVSHNGKGALWKVLPAKPEFTVKMIVTMNRMIESLFEEFPELKDKPVKEKKGGKKQVDKAVNKVDKLPIEGKKTPAKVDNQLSTKEKPVVNQKKRRTALIPDSYVPGEGIRMVLPNRSTIDPSHSDIIRVD